MLGSLSARLCSKTLSGFLLALSLALPAQAGMVGTDRVLDEARLAPDALSPALQRDEVRARLAQLGVSAEAARVRVERMTDAEVAYLHQRIDGLPAGGDLSTVELLLIIILIVLLI